MQHIRGTREMKYEYMQMKILIEEQQQILE